VSTHEEFWLTLVRVVEGTYAIQEAHCRSLCLPWNARKAQRSAQEMFARMWAFKFLPPGRGLWMMGTPYVQRKLGASLNNCAFCSTKDLRSSFSDPFCFLMDMSMLGVGVGGDLKGAGTVSLRKPRVGGDIHVVEDSREGWVGLIRRVLDAYVGSDTLPTQVDYSRVRPLGSTIVGFGGVASGPGPLCELVENIQKVLNPLIGECITSTAIADLFNIIGRCVVSGGVRRTAEILFGSPDDAEFLNLKNRDLWPEENDSWRWASNNSIFATIGMNYADVAAQTARNGEPGYVWLDNIRGYSRMGDAADFRDASADGCNPCAEQSLEDREVCCLVETFPARHEISADFFRTLKFAYLYAKTVTLVPTHNLRTNAVVMRNRRIGASQSGIVQAFARHGRRVMFEWCKEGYTYIKELDRIYARWLCVPESIKKTSVKPSGTVSLLPGATPGIHYPESEYYYRVIRFTPNSPLVTALAAAGYRCIEEPNTTAVYFAVREAFFTRSKYDISMWEQLENVAQYQALWADNQVSATITFTPEEAPYLGSALELYETRLKGISFLPLRNHGYLHLPYQAITESEYTAYMEKLSPVDWNIAEAAGVVEPERFCDGGTCTVSVP